MNVCLVNRENANLLPSEINFPGREKRNQFQSPGGSGIPVLWGGILPHSQVGVLRKNTIAMFAPAMHRSTDQGSALFEVDD